ncbi:MAG: hypothetical protein IJJ33_03145 [Victivallales bacterium]|nr:hypothetical protein [Victivallales bacterium]
MKRTMFASLLLLGALCIASKTFALEDFSGPVGRRVNGEKAKNAVQGTEKPHRFQAMAVIPFAARRPVIDGNIDREEWADAAVLGGFCDLTWSTSDKPVTVYAKWDDERLYFAFRSKKRFLAEATRLPRDDDGIVQNDAIEINLAPNGDKWFKLVFDPAGSRYDQALIGSTVVPGDGWNPTWEIANRLLHDDYYVQDVWEAEVAIPFASLGQPTPDAGQAWRVQLCRDYDDIQKLGYALPKRWTAWDGGGSFMEPDRFGKFVFVKRCAFFRLDRLADFADGSLGVIGKIHAPDGAPSGEVLLKGGVANDPENQFLDGKIPTGGDVRVGVVARISEECEVDYNWSVNVGDKVIASGRARGRCAPPFAVSLAPLYTENRLWADGDVTRLSGLPTNRRVSICLTDDSGDRLLEIDEDISGKDKFMFPIDITGVRPGYFRAVVRLKGADGTTLAEIDRRMRRPPDPEWNRRGEVGRITAPPPGWAELRTLVSGSEMTFSTFGKEYVYGKGALPESVIIRQRPFLAAPMELSVNSRPVEIQEIRLSKTSNVESELLFSGRSADGRLAVSGKVIIAFDGLIWNDLTLIPLDAGVEVLEELSISLPLVREDLRYLRAKNNMNFLGSIGMRYLALVGDAKIADMAFPQPEDGGNFSVTGWKWSDKFCNFYWVGGVDFGMFAMFKSPRNMRTEEYSRVTESADRITLTFPLVSSALEISGDGRRYEFGFIGTPVRDIGDRNRL